MSAIDTLRSPQAKSPFRASISFLILMAVSMTEVAELCSGAMICNNKHREITEFDTFYTVGPPVST